MPKDHELVKSLSILIGETCKSCAEKKIKISPKHEKKLKIMSILSCFVGSSVYSLSRLERELACKKEEVLNLLVEASIFKLMAVQIDEESGQIRISKSKIRERDTDGETGNYLKGKLIQM